MSNPSSETSHNTQAHTPQELSLKQNMAWNTFGSLTRIAANYLITIVVVRLSEGYDAAGALSLAMSISNMFYPFAEMRLRVLYVTDTKDEHSSQEYLGFRVVSTVLAFVAGFLYALFTSSAASLMAVIIYLILSLFQTFIEGFYAIDQRHNRMDYIGKSYFMQGVGTFTLFCVGMYTTRSLELSLLLMMLAVVLIFVLYDLPQARKFENVHPVIHPKEVVKKLATLMPLAAAQAACSAVLTLPRQYLAFTMGSAALGIYASVAAPTTIIQMGATYIYNPLLGTLADSFSQSTKAGLTMLAKIMGAIFITGLVLIGLLMVCGDWVLELLFGRSIAEYTYLLLPAMICTFVTAFSWFLNDVMVSLRNYKASFVGNIAAVLTSLATFRVFISTQGMNGVSITGIISYAVSIVVLIIFLIVGLKKRTKS